MYILTCVQNLTKCTVCTKCHNLDFKYISSKTTPLSSFLCSPDKEQCVLTLFYVQEHIPDLWNFKYRFQALGALFNLPISRKLQQWQRFKLDNASLFSAFILWIRSSVNIFLLPVQAPVEE